MHKPLLALCAALALTGPAHALDATLVTNVKKQTTLHLYLTAQEAAAMKARDAGVLFIDVRTPEEAMFVGISAAVDANVPYKLFPAIDLAEYDADRKAYKLDSNSAFAQRIERLVAGRGGSKATPVILMCRSGDRSAAAADFLAKAGYSQVYTVVDGFEGDLNKNTGRRDLNGWKNAGLPWGYELDKAKAYRAE